MYYDEVECYRKTYEFSSVWWLNILHILWVLAPRNNFLNYSIHNLGRPFWPGTWGDKLIEYIFQQQRYSILSVDWWVVHECRRRALAGRWLMNSDGVTDSTGKSRLTFVPSCMLAEPLFGASMSSSIMKPCKFTHAPGNSHPDSILPLAPQWCLIQQWRQRLCRKWPHFDQTALKQSPWSVECLCCRWSCSWLPSLILWCRLCLNIFCVLTKRTQNESPGTFGTMLRRLSYCALWDCCLWAAL